jgi:UDP-N-acetylmuramate--alanine ligase
MNIYFSGIGGVGIGPLAEMALDAGHQVQGSDRSESPITAMLRSRAVAIDLAQDGAFLEACHSDTPIDWFVHTAALPSDHPELLLAQSLGIHIAKRDELLAHIIKEKRLKLIAVSGTHGKTTTTGMLVWVFLQLGLPVSYSIGTTLSFGPSGKFDPQSDYFIYECDEFDRNFLHFSPTLAVLPSIDYDHSDVYPTKEDYLQAFKQFISQSDATIMWQHDNAKGIDATAENGWILGDNEVMDIHLPGIHYRQNGTLTAKAIEYLKLADPGTTVDILNRFPGTDRRFERLGDNLYSDYGHHPSEIKAMLQLAREMSDHVVLVYQPHQNVRQYEVRDEYTDCFEPAEKIYWLPTYLSRENPQLAILTPQELTRNITNHDSVEQVEMNDDLWEHIQKARDEGKLVLCMGAGSIDGWVRDQLKATDAASL